MLFVKGLYGPREDLGFESFAWWSGGILPPVLSCPRRRWVSSRILVVDSAFSGLLLLAAQEKLLSPAGPGEGWVRRPSGVGALFVGGNAVRGAR